PLPARGERWSARLVCAPTSLAEFCERVGGEAAARVTRGGRRLRALDPGLGGRARLRRQLRHLGKRAGNIAARTFGLAAREDRGGVAPWRLVDAADADEFLGICLQFAQHALARHGGRLQRRRKFGELALERRGRWHAGRRERLERRDEFRIAAERLDGRERARKRLAALDRGVERIRGEREANGAIAAFHRLLAALDPRHAVGQGLELAAHGDGRIGKFLRKLLVAAAERTDGLGQRL